MASYLLLFSFLFTFQNLGAAPIPMAFESQDPYLWLEDIEGERSLQWVKEQNQATLDQLQSQPQFETYKKSILNILNSKEKIPYATIRGSYVYNFWQDEKNVRGLWRRTPLKEYLKNNPNWESLLDVDQLAVKEEKNWVYKGADCFRSPSTRCLIKLSNGGKDAVEIREFDLGQKVFVTNGFFLPEAKSDVNWIHENLIAVGTHFDSDSLTNSGYPRVIKLWQRGKGIKKESLFEGQKSDVGVWTSLLSHASDHYLLVDRALSFFESELYLSERNNPSQLVPLHLKKDISIKGLYKNQLLIQLQSDTPFGERTYHEGELLSLDLEHFFTNKTWPTPQLVFSPNPKQALQSVSFTKNSVLITYLEDVNGTLASVDRVDQHWQVRPISMPKNGTLSISFSDPESEHYLIGYESFLSPDSLYLGRDTNSLQKSQAPQLIKQTPHYFSIKGLQVHQFFATSRDGTQVPYFVIAKAPLQQNQPRKTLLYGYGGFRVSETPFYSGPIGKVWLEEGGVFVLANIRGGSEYGPRWHREALKENRQKAFDDFIAIAEDLTQNKKITSPQKLGIMGGSNGGLLMGAVMVQRPELFGAVVIQVPLLDMLRYHKLLAGASWMGEYGNPDDPAMRPSILAYSPYQNLQPGVHYPTPLFVTSTKDDRVHPGHARKMAAKMQGFGQPFYYYENTDGGHSASANLAERAKRNALEFVYLNLMLNP